MSIGNLLGAAGTVGSVYGAIDAADDISSMGNTIQSNLNTMGQNAANNSAFQGYGVTSTLGNSTVGADGSLNLGVGQNQGLNSGGMNMFNNAGNAFNQAQQGLGASQQGMLGASQQAMNNAMQPTAGREQDIYNRTMAMQNPQLDAAQAQQQAREYAMGRGGVMGSQFGGTAEDAAMAKARAQASNQAAFGAMNQAQTEMMNQGTLSSQFGQMGQNAAQLQGQLGQQQGGMGLDAYTNSFLPMQQQMALLQQGNHGADAAQTGQLTGQGYLTQLGLGGAQTNVNAQNVAAQLKGNLYDSILDNIGGSSTSEGGMSGLVGMLEGIFKP
jgi:hypothetical protein